MLTVLVPANVPPQTIDFPSSVADRSCKGSVHVRPASTLEITQAEWDHLAKAEPALFRKLIKIDQPPVKQAPPADEEAAKAVDQKLEKAEKADPKKR